LILAIDPGTTQSAYVLLDENLRPVKHDILPNEKMLEEIEYLAQETSTIAIEMIASYGIAVGAETFETVFWIGRFWQAALDAGYVNMAKIGRMEVKLNLCHTTKAKDANIRQALIDRFGPVGTAKNPGFFYGVKSHIWAAIAVGVTYADRLPFDEVVSGEE
jgi:hypothetical protein